jgi:hypothetical protein
LSERFYLQPLIPAFRIAAHILEKRYTRRYFLLILFFELIILTFLIIARKDTDCWLLVQDAITRPTNDPLQAKTIVGLHADRWSGT